jgi:hypothetical protein
MMDTQNTSHTEITETDETKSPSLDFSRFTFDISPKEAFDYYVKGFYHKDPSSVKIFIQALAVEALAVPEAQKIERPISLKEKSEDEIQGWKLNYLADFLLLTPKVLKKATDDKVSNKPQDAELSLREFVDNALKEILDPAEITQLFAVLIKKEMHKITQTTNLFLREDSFLTTFMRLFHFNLPAKNHDISKKIHFTSSFDFFSDKEVENYVLEIKKEIDSILNLVNNLKDNKFEIKKSYNNFLFMLREKDIPSKIRAFFNVMLDLNDKKKHKLSHKNLLGSYFINHFISAITLNYIANIHKPEQIAKKAFENSIGFLKDIFSSAPGTLCRNKKNTDDSKITSYADNNVDHSFGAELKELRNQLNKLFQTKEEEIVAHWIRSARSARSASEEDITFKNDQQKTRVRDSIYLYQANPATIFFEQQFQSQRSWRASRFGSLASSPSPARTQSTGSLPSPTLSRKKGAPSMIGPLEEIALGDTLAPNAASHAKRNLLKRASTAFFSLRGSSKKTDLSSQPEKPSENQKHQSFSSYDSGK